MAADGTDGSADGTDMSADGTDEVGGRGWVGGRHRWVGRAARIQSFSNFEETLHPAIFQIPLFAKFTISLRRWMQKNTKA